MHLTPNNLRPVGAPRGVRKISINTFKDERALQPN